MSFRKGADVDEELWPAEEFGGVSDQQFWDDLASDKPLTTTARTAQQEPGTRNRPLAAAPPAATRPAQNTRPPQNMTGPPQNTQPVQNMTQPVQNMTQPVPGVTQAVQATAGASRPVSTASQPAGAAPQPAEARERRRASSADEDPLTSAAFSLRSSGPVDGRSSRRSRDVTREQYDSAVTQGTQVFSVADTEAASGRSVLPRSGTSYGDPSSVTQAMNTPPYGENYGYGSGGPPRADDPRRQNGTQSHARHGGTGEGTRAAKQAYPQDGDQADGYQGPGGYPADGYPAGSQQGHGYQGNGHRAPYDPREDYRRLTPPY